MTDKEKELRRIEELKVIIQYLRKNIVDIATITATDSPLALTGVEQLKEKVMLLDEYVTEFRKINLKL